MRKFKDMPRTARIGLVVGLGAMLAVAIGLAFGVPAFFNMLTAVRDAMGTGSSVMDAVSVTDPKQISLRQAVEIDATSNAPLLEKGAREWRQDVGAIKRTQQLNFRFHGNPAAIIAEIFYRVDGSRKSSQVTVELIRRGNKWKLLQITSDDL